MTFLESPVSRPPSLLMALSEPCPVHGHFRFAPTNPQMWCNALNNRQQKQTLLCLSCEVWPHEINGTNNFTQPCACVENGGSPE